VVVGIGKDAAGTVTLLPTNTMHDALLTLTQFCALLKTELFCRAYKTLPQRLHDSLDCNDAAPTRTHLLTYLIISIDYFGVCVKQEEESQEGADGTLGYTRLFECAPHRGYFTGLQNVRKDSRFTESSQFVHRNPNLS